MNSSNGTDQKEAWQIAMDNFNAEETIEGAKKLYKEVSRYIKINTKEPKPMIFYWIFSKFLVEGTFRALIRDFKNIASIEAATKEFIDMIKYTSENSIKEIKENRNEQLDSRLKELTE